MKMFVEVAIQSDVSEDNTFGPAVPGDVLETMTFVSSSLEKTFENGHQLWSYESPFFGTLLKAFGNLISSDHLVVIAYHGETV